MAGNRAFMPFGPVQKAGSIANAGLFGTSGNLPTGSSPVDPPILTGANLPNNAFAPTGPQVNVTWTGNEHAPYWNQPPANTNMGGPQGSVYTIDPNTNQPVYNVTGSPRPGFFDSRTGKVVETLGSAGLNMFIPGLGFVSRAIFDAIRNRARNRNTGTDLSGHQQPGDSTHPAERTAERTAEQTGPAWYQRGYQPSAGIQAAIARGDYETAYGASPGSINSAKIMWSQAYGGNPNNMRSAATEGRFLTNDDGDVTQQPAMYGNPNATGGFHMSQKTGGPALRLNTADSYNQWLMAQPEYRQWAARRGG